MSETEQTKKYHPSPARRQKPTSQDGSQSNGASQSIAGSANHSPSPDAIKELKKTERGYADLKKGTKKA